MPGAPAAPAAPPRALTKARRLSYKDQRELDAMPEKIQRLEAEQLQLQAVITEPALFQSSDPRGTLALQRLAALAAELEACYARWDALESSGAAAG